MSNLFSVINHSIVSEKEALVHVSDLSIQRGYGIFDYFRTVNGKPVFLDAHIERFYNSAKSMHLNTSVNSQELKDLIYKLISANNLPYSGIRITLTGGYSTDGYTIASPNLFITQSAFNFNKNNFANGIKLISYEYARELPLIKTINYLQAIYLQPLIKSKNADDVIYYSNNEILECPRANIFIVTQENELLTPANGVLKGITRNTILSFNEFGGKEAAITLEQLYNAKEVFITSTTKNVLPVLAINDQLIGTGQPGIISSRIYEKLIQLKEV